VTTTETPTPEQVLALPLGRNEAEAATVRDYLIKLLAVVWRYGEDAIKRPFGMSGWAHDLYAPLVRTGIIEGSYDEDGYVEDVDHRAGDKVIADAIAILAGPAQVKIQLTPETVLRQLLAEIVEHDTDYVTRYPLVFRAVPLALDCGYAAGIRIDLAEPEWPVVYIELPTGQVSWHMPQFEPAFDGHTTEEKFTRIREYLASPERT
jgi:hypothetical protein